MKKNIVIIALTIFVVVFIGTAMMGCGVATPAASEKILNTTSTKPPDRFVKLSNEKIGDDSSVWVDTATGIEYIYVKSNGANAGTSVQFVPLLYGDGRPVIYDPETNGVKPRT